MPDEWVSEPAPYVDAASPIALSPRTHARHARAVEKVLGDNTARYPRPSRGRTTAAAAGCWAKLASGSSIGAGSGLSLGSGTVNICKRSGASLTATLETVTCYNVGPAITATGGDKVVRLSWVDAWVVSNCG